MADLNFNFNETSTKPAQKRKIGPQELVEAGKKGLRSVLGTPKTIAPYMPMAGSVVGGMFTPSVVGSALGGVAGRAAGTQLKAELESAPAKGLSRIIEPSVPGIGSLTRGITQDQQRDVSKRIVKEAPGEFAAGIAGGLVGKGLKGMRPMMGKYFTKQAQAMDNAVTAMRNTKGKPIGDMVTKHTGEFTDALGTAGAWDMLPDPIKKYLTKNARIFNIRFIGKGASAVPENELANLQAVKEGIGDFMTTKDWTEVGKASKEAVKNAYRGIRDEMVKVVPDLGPLLDDYHNFMTDEYGPVQLILKKGGKLREKGLRSVLSPGAEETKQTVVENIAKKSELADVAMRNVRDALRRRAVGKTIRENIVPAGIAGAAMGGIGLFGISRLARRGLFGGGATGEGQGGQ